MQKKIELSDERKSCFTLAFDTNKQRIYANEKYRRTRKKNNAKPKRERMWGGALK